MSALSIFRENMIPCRTESLHFIVLLNSATKARVPLKGSEMDKGSISNVLHKGPIQRALNCSNRDVGYNIAYM